MLTNSIFYLNEPFSSPSVSIFFIYHFSILCLQKYQQKWFYCFKKNKNKELDFCLKRFVRKIEIENVVPN